MNKFLSFIADRIYTFLLNSFFVVILHKKTNCVKSVFSCREDRRDRSDILTASLGNPIPKNFKHSIAEIHALGIVNFCII